jgi:DNA-binding response OmpR family regulator
MKNILVVEDDTDLRNQINKILTILGINVDEAKDGKEELNKALNNDYDLVLCDVKMPRMDGYKLIEELKKAKEKKTMPFIFITSNIDREQIRQGMNLGADDYLTKPFTIEELTKSITTRMKKNKALSDNYEEKYRTQIETLENNLYYNSITGLPNEQSLLKKLEEIDVGEVVMIYISISGLKEISDFISYKSIDNIQREITQKMKSCEYKNTVFFHLKDDEFFILINNEDSGSDEKITEKIENYSKDLLGKIKSPMGSLEYELIFSAGIGINITKVFNVNETFESYKASKMAKDYAVAMGGNGYYFYNKGLRDNYYEVSKKLLSKYINIDEKRKNFRKNKDENIANNFEIKIFFLYPHSIIQKDLINEIISNEYAAYMLNDHLKALKLIEKYNNSILFINIDSTLPGGDWDNYIKNIMNNQDSKEVRIGVLSYYEDIATIEKYIMKMMVPCGFVRLKLGLKECKNIIIGALEANEAKGTRKYIRVNCKDIPSVYFSIKLNYKLIKGFIYDISSTGMACGFDKDVELFLRKDSIIEDIQLKLRGNLCLLSGKVAGIHHDDENNIRYVVMFDKIKSDDRKKIYNFIGSFLQESIDKEIEQL